MSARSATADEARNSSEQVSSSLLLPVLLLIHGQSFQFGAGSTLDPTEFVRQTKIIVVTINYRLNILGKHTQNEREKSSHRLFGSITWRPLNKMDSDTHTASVFSRYSRSIVVVDHLDSRLDARTKVNYSSAQLIIQQQQQPLTNSTCFCRPPTGNSISTLCLNSTQIDSLVAGFPPKLGAGDNSRANLGLMDQIAALHWIRDNIGAFGGARDQVTVLGAKEGAIFVNLLMLSPLAKGKLVADLDSLLFALCCFVVCNFPEQLITPT